MAAAAAAHDNATAKNEYRILSIGGLNIVVIIYPQRYNKEMKVCAKWKGSAVNNLVIKKGVMSRSTFSMCIMILLAKVV